VVDEVIFSDFALEFADGGVDLFGDIVVGYLGDILKTVAEGKGGKRWGPCVS
jgi:hypothetical protein